MAVNLNPPSAYPVVRGFRMGAVDAGIRKSRGEDLAVIAIPAAAGIAGVFTHNRARAAPVEVAVHHLDRAGARHPGTSRALVINSGNANAGLGSQGVDDCLAVCDMVAGQMGIARESVIPFSTGVIGERLPLEKFKAHVGDCVKALGEGNWPGAARAIMTTDTVPKVVSKVMQLDADRQVCVSGMAKGSGMISPNMATMLAFIATDARAPPEYLQSVLDKAVSESFNCISIDGDTSTNDACLLVATAESGIDMNGQTAGELQASFAEAVRDVAVELAQAIVRDGEGATKFVTIRVTRGATNADCLKIAKTVANSPLVKTAFYAADPNWGRIYAAIGRAEVPRLDLSHVSIRINDVEVMSQGALNPDYCEAHAAAAMAEAEFSIVIDLGGDDESGSATVWTSDLSYEYVRINAEYRS